jgi:glycerol-3-phosphate cytidylyltransferase
MKKGFACGVFDLFHAGHVLMLKECKDYCDYLVVAINKAENIDQSINPDKKPPFYSFQERKLIMDSCKFVDQVVGYNSEEELVQIMELGNYNIRFLGADYVGKVITSPEAIPEIHYTNRDHGLSTSLIKSKIREG